MSLNKDAVYAKIAGNLLKSNFYVIFPFSVKFKKFIAFTLAEVLITLLIIGIVASMVIPNLINDTNDAELKVAGKKVYSTLCDAARMVRTDRGGTIAPGFTSQDNFKNTFIPYLNIAKNCPDNQYLGNCWNSIGGYCGDYGGTCDSGIFQFAGWWAGNAALTLNNGSCIMFEWSSTWHNNCNGTDGAGVCGRIYVDVNCQKGPNTVNKDIFLFRLNQNGQIGPVYGSGNYFLDFLK